MLLMDRGSIAELMRVARGGLLGDENPTYGPMNGAMPAPPQIPPQNAGMGAPPNAGPPQMAQPSLPPMPQAPQEPGLLSRINSGVRGALGGDAMPAGYESLFSKEDLVRARPSTKSLLANWILGPSGQDIVRGNLDAMGAGRKMAEEEGKQKELEAGRAEMLANLGPIPENATPAQLNLRMQRIMANRMAAGDTDFLKMISGGALSAVQPPGERAAPRIPPLVKTFADGVKQSLDGGVTWQKIGEAPRPERPERTPLIQEFEEGGKAVKKISYDNGRSWQMLGNAYKAGAATQQDADLAAREAIRSYNNLLGEPDEKGERHIKDPPGWWNRVMTKSDVTNPLATDDGQAYMNNVRNLVRSWVVTVEGKRMSDADAIANEMLKSFRFGSGKGADEQTKARLEGMADDIRRKIRNDGPSTEGRKTKTITVNGKTFIVPES